MLAVVVFPTLASSDTRWASFCFGMLLGGPSVVNSIRMGT